MKSVKYNIALRIEYNGTSYCGWQFQPHCNSVQGQLEKALSIIADEDIRLICAGRTDTGVHSVGQIVNFYTLSNRLIRAWVQGANTHLPKDIRVVWAQNVPDDFHSRFSALSRQYRYVIYNRNVNSAILADRVAWESLTLDHEKMNLAAQALIGELDFSAFRASSCQALHAKRHIRYLNVIRQGDFVFIDIQANAFLHHMVRNIAGSLLEIGIGKKPIDWLVDILISKDRSKAGITAPASGLYFVNVLYPDTFKIPPTILDETLWKI